MDSLKEKIIKAFDPTSSIEELNLFLDYRSSDYDLSPIKVKPKNINYKLAAILIPIIEYSGAVQVLFTRRSNNLKHHPGQISFPGGKADLCDRSLLDTALREVDEEIGVEKHLIRVIGKLKQHETVTGFRIQPYVGLLNVGINYKINQTEVDEVFEIPLEFLLNSKNMRVESFTFNGIERSYYTIPYGPYYIWGATARIIKSLADRLNY